MTKATLKPNVSRYLLIAAWAAAFYSQPKCLFFLECLTQ